MLKDCCSFCPKKRPVTIITGQFGDVPAEELQVLTISDYEPQISDEEIEALIKHFNDEEEKEEEEASADSSEDGAVAEASE